MKHVYDQITVTIDQNLNTCAQVIFSEQVFVWVVFWTSELQLYRRACCQLSYTTSLILPMSSYKISTQTLKLCAVLKMVLTSLVLIKRWT
jgi:hypothetical protein